MSKRKTIGRTFTSKSLTCESTKRSENIRTFVMASGKHVVFTLQSIHAAELEAKTFVDLETNGRDQQALTKESVADIVRTIGLQQFFPAIGRKVGDRIEVLDGSRRRAAALFAQAELKILVTDENITTEDARQLAADIQTAREHNLREIGMRLLVLRDSGMSQKDIASSQNLSTAKVTRAIQAASVPPEMLSVFPDHSELSYPDYKALLDISMSLSTKGNDLVEVVAQVMLEKSELDEDLAPDEVKAALVTLYRQVANRQLKKPKGKTVKVEKLWQFEDNNTFARKRTKDRQFNYEFNRVPKALQNELDAVIEETLRRYLG
ncbi:ParB/RepB/Spo0J family partition protein [Vibrio sp. Of7-15]|uniref:ParB family protein n=1 Tax=Vibrio sp. Of7-15 TaxID=2724879 RepID=UPI001EF28C43|nr:ParB family protein [Vibrio sp. Of7-15]MCG7500115.1 ParB/RepB/Spo0J family partition protein [Vibrio sp. Of7-15]